MTQEEFIKALGIQYEFTFNGLSYTVSDVEIVAHAGNLYDSIKMWPDDKVKPKCITVSIDLYYKPSED